MRTTSIQKYVCEICETQYATEDAALKCEERQITQDRGVKKGDIVMIVAGQGAGHRARVTHTWVVDREWGHYAWERYWHTIMVVADVLDGGTGSRQLTFDSYEVIK